MNLTTSSRRKRWFFARSLARAYREMLENRKKKRAAAPKRQLFAEALEPRVLFSGTPVPVDPEQVEEANGQEQTAQTAEMLEAAANSDAFETGIDGIQNITIEAGESLDFDEADIERLATEAIARWDESGLTDEQLEALERLNYVVTDLGGRTVGAVEGDTVYLDDNAGGLGWFVDETEALDEEFVTFDGYWDAVTDEAMEGIDLLTVILHEQGHILGLADLEEAGDIDGLMGESIEEGQRWLPNSGMANGATPGSLEGIHFLTAGDDGSSGAPFLTTDEDTAVNSSPDSVLTNDDPGSGIRSILTVDEYSQRGARITMNPDGTFEYDPSISGELQTLGSGESVTDTFTYTILDSVALTPGVTEELNATSGVNSMGVTGLPALVSASGTSLPSPISQAWEFDGASAAVRSDFRADPSGADAADVTLEFWIKPDVVNQNMILFETGGATDGSALFINDNGTVSWLVKDGGSDATATTANTLTAGEWAQVTITYDRNAASGKDEIAVYINGDNAMRGFDDSQTALETWSGSDDAGIGGVNSAIGGQTATSEPAAGLANYGSFDGQLGTIRFYQAKALSASEVQNNYNAIAGGETATATVTIEVNGVNDAPGAANDLVGDAVYDNVVYQSTRDLTANDGIIRVADDGTTDILVANFDSSSATDGRWRNFGSAGGSNLDWQFGSGVTLDTSVTTSRAGITAAYQFDGTTSAFAFLDDGSGGDSPSDILGSSVDQTNSTLEFWVKLGANDLSQISTLFETGGGTGIGVVVDNGVIKAATETDGDGESGSFVSYDLVADALGVLGAETATSEFFQVALSIEVGGGLGLYVNGRRVDVSSSGVGGDWDGGDGAGLGHFGGATTAVS